MIFHISATETPMFPDGALWWYADPPAQAAIGDLSYDGAVGLWMMWDGSKWIGLRP